MNNENGLLLLNIGAGSHKLPGFINVDIEPGADVIADLTDGLPFANGTVDGIFSEHFIEHITQAEGCHFFRECRRVLRPGGVIRISTPDLDEIVSQFNAGGANSSENPTGWLHPDWMRFGYEWVANRAEMMNIAMREWGHKWIYNEEEMVRLATWCGLDFKGRFEKGKSRLPWFTNLEHRDGSTLILEFQKPVRRAFGGNPLVSVCIPAYKPTYFREALDSVLAQTYTNLEIIISDDARDEGISNIAKDYLKDFRFRYVKNPVHGGDENYIFSMRQATGDYIKIFNDDDILVPDCIEKLVKAAEENPYATLITSSRQQFLDPFEKIPQSGPFAPISDKPLYIEGQLAAKTVLEKRVNFIGEPNCSLFRRSDIGRTKPDLLHIGNQKGVMGTPGDVVMWLNLLSAGDLVYLPECLSYLRTHPNQIQQLPDYQNKGIAAWQRMIQQAVRLGLHKMSSFQRETMRILHHPAPKEDKAALEIQDFISKGDAKTATALLQKYMQANPNSETALLLLGDLFMKVGRENDARETWQAGLQQYPASISLRERLGKNA
jgi:predicted SAM-dependent methyltransferase